MHREKTSYLAGIYTSWEDFMPRQIYTSREDFIPRWNLDIVRRLHTSLKFMHHEKNPYLVEIYTSREDFIPRWNLCITRRIHASLKIMHRGIMHSGIMHRGNHASQNHASRVINYARREYFMPRQNICIARRLHTSLEFIHREKNLCLAGIHASRNHASRKSCIASQ